MIGVKEIYKDELDESGELKSWIADYQPMIDAFGKVLLQISDDDYSGDTRVLLAKDGKIGHLIFGWGSCCGCDALQGCNTIEEVQELCDELENAIYWFDTPEEALKWFKEHDWEGDYSWHDENTRLYILQAQAVLSFFINAIRTEKGERGPNTRDLLKEYFGIKKEEVLKDDKT